MDDQTNHIVFRGPFPEREVPTTPISTFVLRHAERLSDKRAMVDATTGESLSYGELSHDARAFAQGLLARGIAPGSVVAIFAPNNVNYPVLFHGIAMAGSTLTTLNPAYTAHEIRLQLDQSGAVLLVTTAALLDRAREASARSTVRHIAVIDGDTIDKDAEPLGAFFGEGETVVPFDPATQVVALPYSSGTTGLPKGVMLTHRNLLASMTAVESAVPLYEDDVTLAVLPFFHIYGMNVIMNPSLAVGATIVTMPRFDLRGFLRAIQDYRVTVVSAAPPMILLLAQCDFLDEYDLSSLRWLMSGAAPLDAVTAAKAQERLGCVVFQAYGMTETSPGVFTNLPTNPGPTESCGLLLTNWESRVVDLATGVDCGVGVDGEILVRGPQVMAGYFKNAEATANAIDAEGYYRSGDVGHVDENGYWYIVDRVKELIKYKGYQVAPAELEAILMSHDAIVDAAVIGLPAGDDGEHPIGYVVSNTDLSDDEVMTYVAERVAHFKRLKRVEFVSEIPKSVSGKILRRVLKDQAMSAQASANPAL